MLSSLELHFQVPPCMMIQVTPSPTNQTWRCNLSLHHSLVLCGHLHAWASRIAFQISSWYGNQKFESFKQFWDSGCNTVLNHGQTHTKHGDARTCWGTNIPSSQRESWITDFLNQPNMNNILRDQPRVQPAMNWKSHPGGGRLKSELFETGPSWYIRYQFTVYIYIYMYVCTNIYIYIYILALSSPRLWLKWILSKHGGCQPNSWPFKQFQSEMYGNPLEFRGHPFSNTPNDTRTSDCWTYIQIYSHYIPVKNPYHNHILKLWYINSHMSSRQNPLHLSSCYCYGYRFWGGLSLSRVFTNQHIRDPTWSKFHS